MEAHTVGPTSKDVPESTIAAQPPSQIPDRNRNKFSKLVFEELLDCNKGCTLQKQRSWTSTGFFT